jgi:hypothetical protein
MLDALSLIFDGLANLAKGPRSPREGVGWARGAWFAFCAAVLLAGIVALVYSIVR